MSRIVLHFIRYFKILILEYAVTLKKKWHYNDKNRKRGVSVNEFLSSYIISFPWNEYNIWLIHSIFRQTLSDEQNNNKGYISLSGIQNAETFEIYKKSLVNGRYLTEEEIVQLKKYYTGHEYVIENKSNSTVNVVNAQIVNGYDGNIAFTTTMNNEPSAMARTWIIAGPIGLFTLGIGWVLGLLATPVVAIVSSKNKTVEIERIFNFKYPFEYISGYEKLRDRKKRISEFYDTYSL